MTVTREELEAAQCWDASDVVPRRPAMTEFRQQTRLGQARWREAGAIRSARNRLFRARVSTRGQWAAAFPSTTPARPVRRS